jgi:ent-copalyl diphosphate synthase
MSSSTQSSNLIHQLRSSLTVANRRPLNTLSSTGVRFVGSKDNKNTRLQCKAVLIPGPEDYKAVFQHEQEDRLVMLFEYSKVDEMINRKNELIDTIQSTLGSLTDGDISMSPYDTAWVALVEDIHGNGGPQFPKSLEWISNNQLPDGSWGDSLVFEAHDRLFCTLACTIALKSWKIHPDKTKKGMEFLKENIWKLQYANPEHMPCGFEVSFPTLIEMGRKLDIEVPDDYPIFKEIYAKRNLKLQRIPKDILHTVPTTLLHTLEGLGMTDLEWEKLLKLRCSNGSFLFSTASTAYALMQTKDENCFKYLNEIVEKFNGGVPHCYPMDLFERLWVVDRLERLGISRYFQSEIKACLDYVYRYWTEEGIFSTRYTTVPDIDDTSMGFRLLRRHGYQVSPDVFRNFEKDGEFFCFALQSTQGVTPIYNLYRACQLLFPGERILEEAKKFSSKFLRDKQACNELLDKWIIAKDLPGEVGYALDVPWYASLPRLETKFFLEQYGGEDDVWIAKILYRMPNISNNKYLELAKLDYKNCQGLHLQEWDSIQKWYTECNLQHFGISKKDLLFTYYLATASIFEPARAKERIAWAQTKILMEAIVSSFENEGTCKTQRSVFLHEFRKHGSDFVTNSWDGNITREHGRGLVAILLKTLNRLLSDAHVQDGEIRHHLHYSWETWIMTWQEDGDMHKGEAELLVRTINLCANFDAPEKLSQLSHPQYKHLSDITNGVCCQLLQLEQQPSCNEIHDNEKCDPVVEIQSKMEELVELVVCASSNDIDSDIKQTFLAVAKSYYYAAHFAPATIDAHIAKVLFERVV